MEKCNSIFLSWLFNSLPPDLHHSVAYANVTMLMDLGDRFSQCNALRIHQLRCELCLLQWEGSIVSAYFTQLKAVWDELATYSNHPICSCGAAKEIAVESES